MAENAATPPTLGQKKKPPTNNYVDNEKLVAELVIYRKAYLEAKEKGLPRPRMSDVIGKAIYDVANNFAKYFRFRNYSFREEMVADAIENCVKYIHNFDVEKAKANNPNAKPNAFAYITKICSFAYIRRIGLEKKQMKVKAEIVKNSGILDRMSDVQDNDEKVYYNQFLAYLQEQVDGKGMDAEEKDSNSDPVLTADGKKKRGRKPKKVASGDPMHQLKSKNWKDVPEEPSSTEISKHSNREV